MHGFLAGPEIGQRLGDTSDAGGMTTLPSSRGRTSDFDVHQPPSASFMARAARDFYRKSTIWRPKFKNSSASQGRDAPFLRASGAKVKAYFLMSGFLNARN